MADTDYEIVLYRKGTTGTITYAQGDSSMVIAGSRRLTRNENDISTLEFSLSNGSNAATENFLSLSFAGWSNGVIGALQLGDYVRYSLYPTKTGSKTQVFYGKVVKLQPRKDGQLLVTAQDFLKVLDKECTKIIYDNYCDRDVLRIQSSAGSDYASGIMSGAVVPLAECAYLGDDKRVTYGDDVNDNSYDLTTTKKVAQVFKAEGEALVGVEHTIYFPTTPFSATVNASIYAYNKETPSTPGVLIKSTTDDGYAASPRFRAVDFKFSFCTKNEPLMLEKGAMYWLVYYSNVVSDDRVEIYTQDPGGGEAVKYCYHYDGSAWNMIANKVFRVKFDWLNKTDLKSDDYSVSSTTIYLYNTPSFKRSQDYQTTINRLLVSYFYGTVTSQEIANALLALNTGLTSGSSANQTATSGTFSTLGKKLIASMQDLADQYQPSGAWAGYQLAFAHYESGGTQYCKFGKRLTTADPSYVTFSHGFDAANDEEIRIIDHSGLELRTDLRPPRVVVIGKNADGNPVCYTVTDRAIAASFETRMEGFANVLKIEDENIVTLADAQARGDGAIAAYQFNVWEGQITVSGVYPDLVDLNTASDSFGSGRIITLNLSPLGITAGKFKVKGIIVEPNQTTITISNADIAVLNAQKYYNVKAAKTEAFFSPVGLVDNIYISVFWDYVFDYDPLYMRLSDIDGYAIPNSYMVRCIKHSMPALNLNVYHAEFERSNGYSIPPYGIGRLTVSRGLSGYPFIDYQLTGTGRDERFDKFKTSRVIVDLMTKVT